MTTRSGLILSTLILFTTAVSGQQQLSFSSGSEQTATIELYTSHGCSSCPPADKWLRQYVDHPDLWSDIIPMAFHVDYWDYLGWRDEFADSQYTQRQQNYARSGDVGSVYTPGLVVKGQEWRGFFRRSQPDLSPGRDIGVLTLNTDRQSATVSFDPAGNSTHTRLTAHVAVLGFGIESDIGAGENRGRVLAEDFVVLGHNSTQTPGGDNQWTLSVPGTVPAKAERLAIVAWVSDSNSPAPLQATGGWLTEPG